MNLDSSFLRRCYLATGATSALIALISWRWVGYDWSGRYAAIALFAWTNWYLLGRALTSFIRKQWFFFFVAGIGKVLNLGWFMLLYLPWTGVEISSFLAGLNTFFFVVVFKILGAAWVESRGWKDPAGSPLYISRSIQSRGGS